jgi:hypothetical protein
MEGHGWFCGQRALLIRSFLGSAAEGSSFLENPKSMMHFLLAK